MRIDAHHHLWRYERETFDWIAPDSVIARDFDAAALTEALAGAGIDVAIVVQARQSSAETQFLLSVAARTPQIVGVVGWIDLRTPDIEAALDRDAAPRLVGYRHIVQDEADPDFLLDPRFVTGVRAVAARRLTYDLLVNHDQLATVPAFLDRVGDARIVLDHVAKPGIASRGWQPWADRLAEAAAFPQLFCKLSGLVTEADHASWTPCDIERYLGHALDLFGPERLIWGSDWPVCLLAACYRQVREIITDFVARHCPEHEMAIFGGNAVRAYALDEAR
jgi:L-fuconolactonase